MRYLLLASRRSGAKADVVVHVRRQIVQIQGEPRPGIGAIVPIPATESSTRINNPAPKIIDLLTNGL